MKWFSFKGISNEIRRIRWPSKKELGTLTGKTLLFLVLFSVFFVLSELVISGLMKLLGVTA